LDDKIKEDEMGENAAHMREMRNPYEILVDKPDSGDAALVGRIILKWTLKKQRMRVSGLRAG
jgi:hypothetical protein